MKKILGIIVLLIGIQSPAQGDLRKNYQIAKTVWKYAAPTGYDIVVDNFVETIEAGSEYLEKDSTNTIIHNDVILLSLIKTKGVTMNILMASYKPNNNNIARFTLEGYAKRMKGFFENGLTKDDSNIVVEVLIEKLIIEVYCSIT